MKYFVALLLVMPSFFACAYSPQAGDIIFHSSQSAQSKAIEQATHSPYSHMGIIFIKQGKPYVFEASSNVKYTPLQIWISRGVNQQYVVKRLKTGPLNKADIKKLQTIADTFINKPYDSLFGWGDDALYCSELVWKIYDRALGIQIGELQKLKDFDLSSPVVKAKLKERYGQQIPYEEKVIAPSVMLESPRLITIN